MFVGVLVSKMKVTSRRSLQARAPDHVLTSERALRTGSTLSTSSFKVNTLVGSRGAVDLSLFLIPTLDRFLYYLSGTPRLSHRHSFSTLLQTPPKNARSDFHLLNRKVRTASPAFEKARMAFAFGNAGPSGFGTTGASSNAQTQTGPDLEEIQTEVSPYTATVHACS